MSSDSDGHNEPPDDGPDKVGYGNPPKETRFKLGQVANPYGRPKGSKNRPHAASNDDLRKIILDEAYRDVTINDPNGPVTVPMAKAIIRSTNVSAVKGNTRAQRNSTELILKTEAEIKRERDHEVEVAINFKIAWQRELVRRKQAGIRGPAVLPHPDHVVVDLATGRVNIKGPATKEEKVAWARWEGYRDVFMAELRELQAERDEPSCPDPEELEAEIAGIKAVLEIVGYALDGQRDAMSMLEGAFLPSSREPIQTSSTRDKSSDAAFGEGLREPLIFKSVESLCGGRATRAHLVSGLFSRSAFDCGARAVESSLLPAFARGCFMIRHEACSLQRKRSSCRRAIDLSLRLAFALRRQSNAMPSGRGSC